MTPIQLANAYAALMNGGHLYRPQRAAANAFHAQQLARINITPRNALCCSTACAALFITARLRARI